MTQITPAQIERALDAVLAITAEGTSENPSGYGPPYKAPWFIIDKRSAEPEVNWPGELIEQVDVPGQVSKALRRARLEAIAAEIGSHDIQYRVAAWMLDCFGPAITMDKVERADRFVEEALELAQATGWTPDRAQALVDYVFARPVGEIGQEVGGVMVTLAALCNVFDVNISAEAKREIDRITQPDVMLKIRAKQAAKPTGSALPGPVQA